MLLLLLLYFPWLISVSKLISLCCLLQHLNRLDLSNLAVKRITTAYANFLKLSLFVPGLVRSALYVVFYSIHSATPQNRSCWCPHFRLEKTHYKWLGQDVWVSRQLNLGSAPACSTVLFQRFLRSTWVRMWIWSCLHFSRTEVPLAWLSFACPVAEVLKLRRSDPEKRARARASKCFSVISDL